MRDITVCGAAAGGLRVLLLLVLVAGAAAAGEVYEWIDAQGVRRFSNTPPPDGATVIRKREETPYDAAADAARQERDAALMEEIRARDAARQAEEAAAARKKAAERAAAQEKERQAAKDQRIRDLEKENRRLKEESERRVIFLPQPGVPVQLPSGVSPP